MTPKEKAKELIVKFKMFYDSVSFMQAKDCALIAVDEIIDNGISERLQTDRNSGGSKEIYW